MVLHVALQWVSAGLLVVSFFVVPATADFLLCVRDGVDLVLEVLRFFEGGPATRSPSVPEVVSEGEESSGKSNAF